MRSLKEGLKFQARAVKSNTLPRTVPTNQLIDLYSKNGLTRDAHKLFDEMPDRNVYSWNTIISAYIRSRNLAKARELFDSCPFKDSVTYNLVISGYARSDGHENDAIELFVRMQKNDEDGARFDEFTLTTMLKLLAKMRILCYGVQVHSLMVKSGNDRSCFALSSLVDMYSKCGRFLDACRVVNGGNVEGMVDSVVKNALVAACCRQGKLEIAREIFLNDRELNNDVTWNTMIAGFAQNGREEEAVEFFKVMAREGYCWDEHTFASLLTAISSMKSLKLGKEVHAWVLKDGTCLNPFISSGIVDIYSKCGDMRYAENVLRTNGMSNVFAITSIIVGYSARGEMEEARKLFDSVAERNFVMWNAIISGYVKLKKCEDAFVVFREFASQIKAVPHDVLLVSMLVSMLGACSIQAGLDPGKQIHAYILRMGITMNEKVVSTLIDMYSKCGFLPYAQRLFERVSYNDTIAYNVMISGYAHHGFEREAIRLFEEMLGKGLKPDAITFIAILSACRHSGLVEAGENYFLLMTKNYAIEPETDHYACMVDLYGRANELEKAAAFMERMPADPGYVVLGTFLNACRVNNNLELAKVAEEKLKLLEMEGDNGSKYIQLANVYASEGKWEEKSRVLRRMRGKQMKKIAACSWIQLGNRVHSFTSGYRSHCEAEAIYSTLGCLTIELSDKVGVDEKPPLLI